MARLPAEQRDRTGRAYIDSGVDNVLERLGDPKNLTARLLSIAMLNDILPAVKESTGSNTTGAFYRRWGSIDELNETLAEEIIFRAFDGEPRETILIHALQSYIKEVERGTCIETQLDLFADSLARGLALEDQFVAVRYHLHPYIGALEIDDSHMVATTTSVLKVIAGFGNTELPEDEEAVRKFLREADLAALTLDL